MAEMNFGGVIETVVTSKEFSLEKAHEVLKDEVIAVIGYGIQGPGQACNLRDNGFNVIVGQREGKTYEKAVNDGWVPGKTLFSIEEAAEKIGSTADVIINVQGDEPFIQPSQIETLMHLFDDSETQIGTLGKRFDTIEAVRNPNSPKIVTDRRGFALYFSRSVIPFIRGVEADEWMPHYPFLKHLGVYAYRREVLAEVTRLPQSALEKAESLEQLRWLENGYRIRVGLTDVETVGIDTPEDLARAGAFLKEMK